MRPVFHPKYREVSGLRINDSKKFNKQIISFRNAQNEVIEAVEVKTEDTAYLVKIGKRLVQAMEDFAEDDDDADDESDDISVDDLDTDEN